MVSSLFVAHGQCPRPHVRTAAQEDRIAFKEQTISELLRQFPRKKAPSTGR